MVFIAAISSLAIINLSQANERMKGLYTQDMVGLGVADDLVITRLSLAEQGRYTILNIDDAESAGKHEKLILSTATQPESAAYRSAYRAQSRGHLLMSQERRHFDEAVP